MKYDAALTADITKITHKMNNNNNNNILNFVR